MGKDCFSCRNMLSNDGHCYVYGMVTENYGTLRDYFLGKEDARNCSHYDPKYGEDDDESLTVTNVYHIITAQPEVTKEVTGNTDGQAGLPRRRRPQNGDDLLLPLRPYQPANIVVTF